MKYFILLLTIVIFPECQMAQEQTDIEQVQSILMRQQEDWNKGDINAFMNGYWESEDLKFVGSRGINKGYKATLEGYHKAYPNKDAMGTLRFEILSADQLSDTVILIIGNYFLTRKEDNPHGIFTLLWRKIKEEWVIVMDHTTAAPE